MLSNNFFIDSTWLIKKGGNGLLKGLKIRRGLKAPKEFRTWLNA
jgi:hypothetical protein